VAGVGACVGGHSEAGGGASDEEAAASDGVGICTLKAGRATGHSP